MKALTIPLVVSLCGYVISFLAVWYIGSIAVHQPSVADAVFRHPYQVKGRIRFLTDLQDHVNSVAWPVMWGSLIVGAVLSCAFYRLHERFKQEVKRRAMDKIAASFEKALTTQATSSDLAP